MLNLNHIIMLSFLESDTSEKEDSHVGEEEEEEEENPELERVLATGNLPSFKTIRQTCTCNYFYALNQIKFISVTKKKPPVKKPPVKQQSPPARSKKLCTKPIPQSKAKRWTRAVSRAAKKAPGNSLSPKVIVVLK